MLGLEHMKSSVTIITICFHVTITIVMIMAIMAITIVMAMMVMTIIIVMVMINLNQLWSYLSCSMTINCGFLDQD